MGISYWDFKTESMVNFQWAALYGHKTRFFNQDFFVGVFHRKSIAKPLAQPEVAPKAFNNINILGLRQRRLWQGLRQRIASRFDPTR